MKLNQNGFSLIELAVVIVILGIVGLSSFVYIGFFKSVKLDGTADKLASDLQYVQSVAMSTATWYGVSFEASPANKYYVYTTTGTVDVLIMDPAKFGSNLVVDTLQQFDTSISSVSISGGNKIEFSPLGQPFSDKLGLPLSAEAIITLSSGNYSKTVRITPNTGRVRVQ